MEAYGLRRVSIEELREYTGDFSEENLIGEFQFGKVYRGKIPDNNGAQKHVLVKIWEIKHRYVVCCDWENDNRLRDELLILQHERFNSHPNLVKLYGYWYQSPEQLGVVYDLNPLDTVHNLISKDSFTWTQRMKVAFEFGRLLQFFQEDSARYMSHVVRNIDPAHIMLDQDYNVKVFDLSMIFGGILPDWSDVRNPIVIGSHGYYDMQCGFLGGQWTKKTDVFSFGVVLLALITKRIYSEEERQANAPTLDEWAARLYELKKTTSATPLSEFTLVDSSLTIDPQFYHRDGCKVTSIAMQCIDESYSERPLMKEVVKQLHKLHIVRQISSSKRKWYCSI